jgi:hypothetical protein
MKTRRLLAYGVIALVLLLTAGCPSLTGDSMPLLPPPPPLDVDKVGQAITKASGDTPGTTIYTNVLNGSGGSCVQAATRRGQAIADTLSGMKSRGEIPSDHTIDVHTYSGYRIPGVEYGTVHTYTVTQVIGPDGKVKHTWTSDNYLGPNRVKHYTGDGGYNDWQDNLTNTVKPTLDPPPKTSGGNSRGGGGGGGHSH